MRQRRSYAALLLAALLLPATAAAQAAAEIPGGLEALRTASLAAPATPERRGLEEWDREGNPPALPALRRGEPERLPFGYAEAVLRCAELQPCLIFLEDGETIPDGVDGLLAGDTYRWHAEVSRSGPGGRRSLVVVSPQDCGLQTGLVIPTDRRVYRISLVSQPCGMKGATHAGSLAFWYPDDERERGRQEAAELEAILRAAPAQEAEEAPRNCAYRWGVRRDVAWTPVSICDDGVRTIVTFSEEAARWPLPVLYEGRGKRLTTVNYIRRDHSFVSDRLLPSGALLLEIDGKTHRINFEQERGRR